jgi:hypothetical protein
VLQVTILSCPDCHGNALLSWPKADKRRTRLRRWPVLAEGSGELAYLKGVSSLGLGETELRHLAERIAAGNAASVPGPSESAVHGALAQGFGRVMLHGGAGVWLMAGLSFVIFNGWVSRTAKAHCAE